MLNITPVSDYVVWVVSSSSNPVRFITSSYVSVRSLSIIASHRFPQISADFLLSILYPVFMQNWINFALVRAKCNNNCAIIKKMKPTYYLSNMAIRL